MLAKKVETLTKAMEVEAKKMRREVAAMEKEVAAMRVDKDQDNRAKRSSNTKPSSNTAQILAARYLTMLCTSLSLSAIKLHFCNQTKLGLLNFCRAAGRSGLTRSTQ